MAVVSQNAQLAHSVHSDSMQNIDNGNNDTHRENYKEKDSTSSSARVADGALHNIVPFQRVKEVESRPHYYRNYKVQNNTGEMSRSNNLSERLEMLTNYKHVEYESIAEPGLMERLPPEVFVSCLLTFG